MCMPVDNFEDLEQENEASLGLSRGPGDPDAHGYPGEPKEQGVASSVTINANPIDLSNVPF
jgi:hypothetical protein